MTRLLRAWRTVGREQHTTALVALGLFVTMLLPWYSKTETVVVHGAASSTEQSLSAFQAFSFVEAAVLLVSAGVLAILFARAERRDFQLPGGDGTIVTIAGAWAAMLIFYRLLDKPGLSGNAKISSTVGVQWGIFIALLVALGLVYCGRRLRAGEHAGPPLSRPHGEGPDAGSGRIRERGERRRSQYRDEEDTPGLREPGDQPVTVARGPAHRRETPAAQGPASAPAGPFVRGAPTDSRRPRYPPPPAPRGARAGRDDEHEQMSFDDAPTEDE